MIQSIESKMNLPLLVSDLVNWYKWNDGIRKVNKDYHCHWKWIEFITVDGELDYIPSSGYTIFRMNKRGGPTIPTDIFDAMHRWISNIQLYTKELQHKNPYSFFGGITNFQIPKNY